MSSFHSNCQRSILTHQLTEITEINTKKDSITIKGHNVVVVAGLTPFALRTQMLMWMISGQLCTCSHHLDPRLGEVQSKSRVGRTIGLQYQVTTLIGLLTMRNSDVPFSFSRSTIFSADGPTWQAETLTLSFSFQHWP